jgi:hypothetical protein
MTPQRIHKQPTPQTLSELATKLEEIFPDTCAMGEMSQFEHGKRAGVQKVVKYIRSFVPREEVKDKHV